MKKEENIKLGISIGDLNGIGSEIVQQSIIDPRILSKIYAKINQKGLNKDLL